MDLTVKIRGGILPNPVGVASGTFGYGIEYKELIDVSRLGALFTKAVTLEPRPGNNIPRLVETPAGLLNSIGLANVGVKSFIADKLDYLSTLSIPVIANIAGSGDEEYMRVIEKLESDGRIWGYEINVSCPNVKEGCLSIGTEPKLVEGLMKNLRDLTEKPVIVKLTPNVTDIATVARAAENGGADAVSCINTLVGMAVDVTNKRPVLPGLTGGLSGPAIRPVGVAMTFRVSSAISIPVIGMGGIMTGDDALQYLLAGASAVQIGTGNFVDPTIPIRVLSEIEIFAETENLSRIADFHVWKKNW